MAKLVTCPDCSAQLVVPLGAALDDRLRCPRCGDEFPLADTVQINLPTAELLPPLEMVFDEDDAEASPQESPVVETTTTSVPTLADWQERLKRAIAAGQIAEDTESEETELDESSEPTANLPEPQTLTEDKTRTPPPKPVLSELSKSFSSVLKLPDFAVPADPLSESESDEPIATPSLGWTDRTELSDSFEEALEEAGTDLFPAASAWQSTPGAEAPHPTAIAPRITIDPRPRRKHSLKFLSTMAAFMAGVVGIPLGLYALLWIKGPVGDVVHMSQYLPQLLLPAAFHAVEPLDEGASQLAQGTESTVTDPQGFTAADALPAETEESLITDTAVEPASVEQPAYEGPRFAPVASADFAALLAASQSAAPQLLAGELADKDSLARMGQAYMALCRLADVGSFVNQPGHSAEDDRQSLAAEDLFRQVLTDAESRVDLAQIASRWWDYTKRPSAGMLLLGRIEQIESTPAGNLGRITLDAGTTLQIIPVLLGSTPCCKGELVGVVGSIVSNPAEEIPALRGQTSPAVVAHLVFDLEAEPVPESEAETLLR
jgi:hypothetical protein